MAVGIKMRPLAYSTIRCMPADDRTFYSSLPVIDAFKDVFDEAAYYPMPADWLLIICQVEAASHAAHPGKYREVNIACAAAIAAVLNATRGLDIPYIFCGDGANFAIPAECRAAVETALAGTRSMARSAFRLALRIGLVPIEDVRAAGHDVRVGRYRLGRISTTLFAGGGLAYAEHLVRGVDHYRLPASHVGDADFKGLECRWKPVEPARGRMLALAIQVTDGNHTLYRDIYATIDRLCSPADGGRPARARTLHLTKNPRRMRSELAVMTHRQSLSAKLAYAVKLLREYKIGRRLFDFGQDYGPLNGKAYKKDILRQMDFQRFDNMLRMIVDVTPSCEAEITAYLGSLYDKGLVHYGLESGGAAQISCLTFSRADNHIHFVDGADGGYAKAGRALQEQIRHTVLTQFQADRARLATLG